MSKFSWRNGFTVGLTVGGGIVILAGLLLSSGQNDVAELAYAADQAADNSYQCGDGNKPVWGPWFGLCFGLFDTLAQWLMMAFTIVAAGLLLGTLIQANKTNLSVLEANQIMRDEQRAWVTLGVGKDCDLHDRGNSLFMTMWVGYENKGKSPAKNINVATHIVKESDDSLIVDGFYRFIDDCVQNSDNAGRPILFPAEASDMATFRHMRGMLTKTDDKINIFICATYTRNSTELGYEARCYMVMPRKDFIGPAGFKLIERSWNRVTV